MNLKIKLTIDAEFYTDNEVPDKETLEQMAIDLVANTLSGNDWMLILEHIVVDSIEVT